MGLASSNGPERHAGRIVATVRAFHAAQGKGNESDKRDSLALHAGIGTCRLKLYNVKFVTIETLLTVEAGRKHLRRHPSKNKDLRKYEDDEL